MVVERLYPYTNPSSERFRKRGIYATDRGDRGSGRGGRFNWRGHGSGCVGRNEKVRVGNGRVDYGGGSGAYENGIDISNVTRYFEDEEWSAISNETRKRTTEDPVHTKLQENKKRHTTRSVSDEKENEKRIIYQITTGVQNTYCNDSGLAGGVIRF